MTTERIRITYCGETALLEWDGAQASAQLRVDGVSIGYQTADARHTTSRAVRLACAKIWGPVYETAEDARADGRGPSDAITVWDDVEFEPDGVED